MTPVQMKYFDAVCHYQSISSAAAVLHISQPTITVAIQTLEKEIGVNLFVRRGKQLILTKEGAIIWSKISPILNSIEQLENDIKDITHNKNHISLAVPPQIGVKLMPKILGDFKKVHPEIELDIIESGGIAALQMLENSEIDLAITNYNDDFSPNLTYIKIGTNDICFCTYKDNPLAKKEYITIEDIKDEPLVLLNGKFFINRVINLALQKAGITPNILQYSSQLYTIKNLVHNQLASTFLMRQAILEHEDIVPISIKPSYYINSGIVYKKGKQLYSDELSLINFLKENYLLQTGK